MPGTRATTGPIVLAAAGMLGFALAAEPPRPFDLQGHRGARGLAPENTLAAFARALEIGVTTLEMDLGVTADGVVVVSHDPSLNPDITRDAHGRWLEQAGPPLVRLEHRQLRDYDVGRLRPDTPYAARFPGQVPAEGERIPTLADVVRLVERTGNASVRFNLETKSDPRRPDPTLAPAPFADAVVRVVREHRLEKRAAIQSFDWRTLRRAREVAPEIQRVCLTVQQPGDDNVEAGRPGAPLTLAGLDVDDFGGSVPRVVQAAGCAVWSPEARGLTPVALAEAHALGLQVVVWTVNEPGAMDALIALGVDGIITDHPDRLRAVMTARGLPLPAPTPVRR